MDEFRRARTATRGMPYVSSTGKRLASLNAAFGVIDATDVEIIRGDLARILHQATSDVEYIFGDSITGICEHADTVEVTFERAPARAFDLVVGADGLHSNVRSLAFGPESPFIRHLGLYLAIFTTPNDLGLDHWQLIHAVPGKSVTITSARENTEARAIFFFASPPLNYDHHDTRQQQDLLASAFSTEQWEVPHLLKAMRHAPDFYFDSASQVRMDNWAAGRVTLLGDAGYCPSPLSGQGTSLALVGAYVLAGELQAAAGDHRAAFARYQQQMSGFVQQNQQIALGNAKRFTPGHAPGSGCRTRPSRHCPTCPGRTSSSTWPPRASARPLAPSRSRTTRSRVPAAARLPLRITHDQVSQKAPALSEWLRVPAKATAPNK